MFYIALTPTPPTPTPHGEEKSGTKKILTFVFFLKKKKKTTTPHTHLKIQSGQETGILSSIFNYNIVH